MAALVEQVVLVELEERPLEVQEVLEEQVEQEVQEVLLLVPFLSWVEQLKPGGYLLHFFYHLILEGLVVEVEDLLLVGVAEVVLP